MQEASAQDVRYPPNAVAREQVVRGELRWSLSWYDAGTRVEEDGLGIAPPRVRTLLLAQHGEWWVEVDEPGARVEVMRVLRTTFQLSLSQADAATLALPGKIYRGTHGEAALLAEGLETAGVRAKVEGSGRL